MRALVVLVLLFGLAFPTKLFADNCGGGQPCGNACISWQDTCHLGGSTSEDNTGVILAVVGVAIFSGIILYFTLRDPPAATHSEDPWGYNQSANIKPVPVQRHGDPECRDQADCWWWGKCSRVEGQCVVLTEMDCRTSTECTEHYRCLAFDRQCVKSVATSTAVPSPDGHRHGDPKCRDQSDCWKGGKCSLDAGKCVVASDEDCKSSAECTGHSRCTAFKGYCVGP